MGAIRAVSDNWRAKRSFIFCQVSNARFHRPNFTKFERNTLIDVAIKLQEHNFENVTAVGGFLPLSHAAKLGH